MSESFENKIKRLELENFTCFGKAEMDFSSGINVLIGENGVGKTHVLKILYAINSVVANLEFEPANPNGDGKLKIKPYHIVTTPLEVFSITDFSDLIRFKSTSLSVNVKFDKSLDFGYKIDGQNISPNFTFLDKLISKPLFIPSHEIISTYKGFIANYLERDSDYDKTFFDLAVNLQKSNLKKQPIAFLQEIQEKTKIDVQLNADGLFYINDGNTSYKAKLSAEGFRKIAQIIQLIKNGSLKSNSILFWDEPEVNLNPRYIKVVVQFLQTLAKNGVQIFVATHDYLLAHLLSVDAEYRAETQAPPMKFFAFYKGEDGTEIESADTLGGIQNNAILDEYSAYYDREQELYYKLRKQTA